MASTFRILRGAAAGAIAAGVWAASEPGLGLLMRTSYSDVRLLGRTVARRDGADWETPGRAIHLANGAIFGALFGAAGGSGLAQGVAAAQAENLALWPGMRVMDRIHPDVRSGAWAPLQGNRKVLAYEIVTHAIFGTVLGLLTARRRSQPSASAT